jgi:DNA polymerase-3 subunit delta'
MRFADVVGHAHVKDLLLRAGRRGRVPHAYLFHGPEGVGKRAMAMAFLSWLVCRDRQGDDACGECVACRQVAAGTHVDLAVLEPEKGYIKIERWREAVPRLLFEPVAGPWKCLVVDDAHAMTLETANAALKTLEEPPSATLFFLVTSAPDTLPRTVASRCFPVPFGPVPAPDVAALLGRRGKAPEEAVAAAARSRGSPGRALRLCESEVLSERVEFIRSLLDAASSGPGDRLRFGDDATREREDVEEHMELVETVVRDVLLAAAGAPDDALCNADLAGPIRAFAESAGPDRALAMVDAWLDWDLARRYAPAARLAVDRLMLSA